MKGEAMKTKILAEDSQILVCFKPAGLAVQSARPGEAAGNGRRRRAWRGGARSC